MSKPRDPPISNCEKKFVFKCLSESKRLDDRTFDEFRELKIDFGEHWGSCHVSLGETKVFAQVTCEIQQPKASRPSEGMLNVNLELSPLAAPNFEGQQSNKSDLAVQLNRLLEKCLKDSRAIDLESLCIKVYEKVWMFRVDVNVLNHEGNILDAASVAALCALAHFRRPDVTCNGEEFVVHKYSERDPIPTVVHHYPICVSYAIFNNGESILADPNLLEENVSEAQLSFGLNAYRELCGVHLGGNAAMDIDSILKTTNNASTRAKQIVELIKSKLEEDNKKRLVKEPIGFHLNLHASTDSCPTETAREEFSKCLDRWNVAKKKKGKKRPRSVAVPEEEEKAVIEAIGKNAAILLPQDPDNKWVASSDEEGVPSVEEPKKKQPRKKRQPKEESMDVEDSEEETVVILNASQKKEKKKKRR